MSAFLTLDTNNALLLKSVCTF